MRSMRIKIWQFLWDEEGPTSVEYAVLLALIIAGVITAIGSLGLRAGGYWGNIRNQIVSYGVGG